MNKLKKELIKKMDSIPYFVQYPKLKPFIGDNYGKTKKILIIGESNYLPKNSTIHLNAENWFNSTQDKLNYKEKEWIDYDKIRVFDENKKGHQFYSIIEKKLKKYFDEDPQLSSLSNIAFINGFQRPAIEHQSIKKSLTNTDLKESVNILGKTIQILEPNVIIFMSKLTWDELKWRVNEKFNLENSIELYFTCHPCTGGRYWNNKKYPHGEVKFNKILKELFSSNL